MQINYIPTVGLEIHTELNTQTKMFCGCKNDPFNSLTNANVCPTCLGLPGSLPVPNKQAILDTIKIGKALGSTIAIATKWDRKHYFYPDLPKNFQISQFDQPICSGGSLPIQGGKKIALTRIHLEEDTGKLTHAAGNDFSLIDLNRAGVPLVELVTEPVIKSAGEAREFCEEYQLVLRILGVSNADMEKGEMRCEVNISLRENSKIQNTNSKQISNSKAQNSKLGTKVEIKNLNSFRSVQRAIEYEIRRQSEILAGGGRITQETRGWNDSKQKTFSQRIKETSADYRYFPEPDIPPVETASLQKEIGALPEMPWEKRKKFKKIGVAEKDARMLTRNLAMGAYFEAIAKKACDPQILANLLINEAPDLKIAGADLAFVANQLAEGAITRQAAKKIIEGIYQGKKLKNLLSEYGSNQKAANLELTVKKVLAENPEVVAKIKAGKREAIKFLVGQAMRATGGRAEASQIINFIKQNMKK